MATKKKSTTGTANKPTADGAHGTLDNSIGSGGQATGAGVGGGEKTKVVVEGESVDKDPLKAARDAKPRKVGAPHAPLTGRMDMPPVTEAQLAAGPPRPEPAKQVRHEPLGNAAPVDTDFDLDAPIKWVTVRALRDGFTGVGASGVRRRAGDVFQVDDRLFSKRWMEVVPKGTPEKKKTGQDVINEENEATAGRRLSRAANHDVIGDHG